MEEVSRMDGINSMEDERIDRFLKLLRSNPEAIESKLIKDEYKNLLNYYFEKLKTKAFGTEYVVFELLKLGILEKSEIKEKYINFLNYVFEKAKTKDFWAKHAVLELLKLGILEKSEIKEKYIDFLNYVFENLLANEGWAKDMVRDLLKLDMLDKSDKERCKNKLNYAFEKAKTHPERAYYLVRALLRLDVLDKSDKERYLDYAFENAKINPDWVFYIVSDLLELDILDKSDKEGYKNKLDCAFENAKTNQRWLFYVVRKLLKLDILDKSDKEWYKNKLDYVFENAKINPDWAKDIVPELLKLDILDKSDKEWYKNKLDCAFENAKINYGWARYIVPELLKVDVLEKSEVKEKYMDLLNCAFEKAKTGYDWVYVISRLLELGILEKSEVKEKYMDLLNYTFEKAKTDELWARYKVPELLKLDILEKSEVKEKYMDLLNHAFEKAETDQRWVSVVPELLKLDILDKSDKEWYKNKLDCVFENAKSAKTSYYWLDHTVSQLLRLDGDIGKRLNIILDKSDKEWYKNKLDYALENAETDQRWVFRVVQWLLKLDILDKSDKEWYKNKLDYAFEKAKTNHDWAEGIVPWLLKLDILDKSDKEWYKNKLDYVLENTKTNHYWAEYIVPELLKLDILEKSDKKWYLDYAFENAKTDEWWARYIVPKLLKLDILDKSDKKWYLDYAFENAEINHYWAEYIVPELLKLYVLEKSEIDVEIVNNVSLRSLSFLERSKDVVDVEDIMFLDGIDDAFSKEEVNYLCNQDYDFFKEIEKAVKENNYQKIWGFKKGIYDSEEKNRLQKMEEYFGEGVWVYFVDKVPGIKLMKNRFRDPHNALLHVDQIINLAKYLETEGITNEEFIKNYLGVAGDRNSGYQQLNNFLEKYKQDWKELVIGAMKTDLKKNREFMNLAKGVLKLETTGELYKNLDNMEQILTLLHMILNKKALNELQKLADSKDPNDKKLYEYYKGAIYHPRTKPIIMKMYEDPEKFLGLGDSTSNNRIHQAKKPSNMVENFEFLDFDAKDLVNCLPLGIYDKLSYFKPFEMKFYISGSDVFTKEELQQKIGEFLIGLGQKKISVIITKLKKQGDETMWFKEWKANKTEFVKKLLGKYGAEGLINMFVNLGYSEFNKYRDLRLMTAKISPKSDPNNRFNGFNCDSLAEGHGKKVVAMFNPYCTDFCIYEGDQDSKEDNLKVTSWVTLNRAIPENFATLLDKVTSETTHDIVSVLGDKFEDYKDPSEYVITMDNMEVNANFGRKNTLSVRKIYEKFFSEYVRQNPISPNGIPINTSKFYSGVNYNRLDVLTDRVPNESLPVFVNAYSDNSESYSLQGKLDAGEQIEKQKKVGIHPLSIEDVVQISYMEGKIYPSSMKDHLGNLQHEITASILNNTLKNRPNLSFAWYNEEGKIGGYILAYQGKMEDGTPGVYISDFAIDEKERGTAGVKMIYYWMQELKKNYPEMPVFTRAREKTSYRMIKALAGSQGYEITTDELMQDGGENFHWVVMEPKKELSGDASIHESKRKGKLSHDKSIGRETKISKSKRGFIARLMRIFSSDGDGIEKEEDIDIS